MNPIETKSRIAMMSSTQSRAAVFWPRAVAQIPRLLGRTDREPHSVTYGNGDRDFWAWKFRDCPVTMFQASVSILAQVWRYPLSDNPYYQNPRLFEWITGMLARILRLQRPNGSFEWWGPHTDHPGIALAMGSAVLELLETLGEQIAPPMLDSLHLMVRRACNFALDSEEDYGFISNHQALYAVAFLRAFECLHDAQYQRRAEQIIDNILKKQSAEGWYCEYQGPDPGYESLGIQYLAIYWQRTGSARVLESLRRSIEFYSHCLQPDGSVGGVYGSRHTALYFPGGFELLAPELPLAASISRFMRERLAWRNVLTPADSDAENLTPLIASYLKACLLPEAEGPPQVPALPCEGLDATLHFSHSGITVAGTPYYYAVANTSKGGVCRIFDKRANKLVYEDAGYLVQDRTHCWASQFIGMGRPIRCKSANELSCTTRFAEIQQELPTPAKFVLLRILNLTLSRSLRLELWMRRKMVARLITAQHPGPLRLQRSIVFTTDKIQFCDQLEIEQAIKVQAVMLPRTFTGIHMGSAKYFHPSELDTTLQMPVSQMAEELNNRRTAKCEFAICFSQTSKPALVIGSTASQTIPSGPEVLKEL